VESSASRKAKNNAVTDAINTRERMYCRKSERKDELRIFAEFIIPL